MYKLCIPITGGLDSFTAYHYAKRYYCYRMGLDFEKDTILVYVNLINSPYAKKEKETIKGLYPHDKIHYIDIKGYYDKVTSMEGHVVLGRNMMLAGLLSGLAEEVWLCGTEYEDNTGMYDKNSAFFKVATQCATQACLYERDIPTIIRSPFQSFGDLGSFLLMEKHHMIEFLEERNIFEWRYTTSCFHPEYLRCGSCPVCGKRYVYEKMAEIKWHILFDKNISLENTYIDNPRENKYLLETLEKMKLAKKTKNYSRYHKERIQCYFEVMNVQQEIKKE